MAADFAFTVPFLFDWSTFMNDILRHVHHNLLGFVVLGKAGFAAIN